MFRTLPNLFFWRRVRRWIGAQKLESFAENLLVLEDHESGRVYGQRAGPEYLSSGRKIEMLEILLEEPGRYGWGRETLGRHIERLRGPAAFLVASTGEGPPMLH